MLGLILLILPMIPLSSLDISDSLSPHTTAFDSNERPYSLSSLCAVVLVSTTPAAPERAVVAGGKSILLTVILFGGKALAQTCTQTPFPKFVGGTNGATHFYSIDYHSATSQLVAGGITYDSGIASSQASSGIPIIVRYQGASFAYSWGIYGPTGSWDGVYSISICSDGSVVLAQLYHGKILVLSATDGALTKAITPSYTFKYNGNPYKSLGMNSGGKILFTGN